LRLHLSVVCNVLEAADRWPPSVPLLVDACNPLRFRAIAALARALDDDEHRVLKRDVRDHQVYVASRDGMKDLTGGGNRLKVALGLASRHVVTPRVTPDGDAVGVRLVEALHARAVVMWRTYVDTMPDEAAALTVLALSDLYDAAGAARATDPELQWMLLLDEFGGVIKLAADKAVAMLERARSSGGQVLVATQSIADVEALTGQVGLLPSLSDNFAAVVAHRQTAPESRDWLSKLMGTREIWQATNATAGHGVQHTGRGSARRAHEFLVQPDEFRRLGRGQAVVFNALGGVPASAQISELHLPDHPAIRIDPNGRRDACETAVHPEDAMPELAATVGERPPDAADLDVDGDEAPVARRPPAPQIDASTLGHQA
jgi:TraM recognition site of TraD and TraG